MSQLAPELFLSIDTDNTLDPERLLRDGGKIEGHERRNDCACDEAVYITEPIHGQSPIGFPLADLYCAGVLWLEVETRFVLNGNAYLDCIFTLDWIGENTGNVGIKNGRSSGVDRHELMLVEIAKFIQLREGMTLRRINSVARLKSVNFFRNLSGKEAQDVEIAPELISGEIVANGKADIAGKIPPCGGQGQLPSHLVKTGAETIEKLPKHHSKIGNEAFKVVPFDVASVLKIIFANDGVRFFKPRTHKLIESVKVRLCPFRFEYQIGRSAEIWHSTT